MNYSFFYFIFLFLSFWIFRLVIRQVLTRSQSHFWTIASQILEIKCVLKFLSLALLNFIWMATTGGPHWTHPSKYRSIKYRSCQSHGTQLTILFTKSLVRVVHRMWLSRSSAAHQNCSLSPSSKLYSMLLCQLYRMFTEPNKASARLWASRHSSLSSSVKCQHPTCMWWTYQSSRPASVGSILMWVEHSSFPGCILAYVMYLYSICSLHQ